MAEHQRKALEALMGLEAMSGTATIGVTPDIEDPSVCRSYLVGECPTDTFVSTRWTVTDCKRKHIASLRDQWQKADPEQKRRWKFEWNYRDALMVEVRECDRRIGSSEGRLEKTQEEAALAQQLVNDIAELDYTIQLYEEEVEALGSDHNVVISGYEEATRSQEIQRLKSEKDAKLNQIAETGGASGHQKLQVCDTCAAYLSRLDNDRRLADHFFGKLHLGFRQIRQEVAKLDQILAEYGPRREDDGYNQSGGGGGARRGGRGGGAAGGGGAWQSSRGGRGGRGGGGGGRGRW